MDVFVIGIHHKNCSLSERERFAKWFSEAFFSSVPGPNTFHRSPKNLPSKHFGSPERAITKIVKSPRVSVSKEGGLSHYVLLSTCNRHEIYFSTLGNQAYPLDLLEAMQASIDSPLQNKLYLHQGKDAFKHLITVMCGLDSALLGEQEIIRQVKNNYLQAVNQRLLTSDMHFVFQKAFKASREIRKIAKFGDLNHSIPQYVSDLIQEKKCKKILFVGYSQMNRLIYHRLDPDKTIEAKICTRNEPQEGIKVVPWSEIMNWKSYDVIICATVHSGYLIDRVTSLHQPKLLLDLSVPRVVDPKLAEHSLITLYNIDQITSAVNASERHHTAIGEISEKIEHALERYYHQFKKYQHPRGHVKERVCL